MNFTDFYAKWGAGDESDYIFEQDTLFLGKRCDTNNPRLA